MKPQEVRDTALLVMLGVMVCGSVLAVGGVPPLVVLALGGVACAAAALLWIEARGGKRPPVAVFAVLGALSVYTALQTVPLPLRSLELMSPSAADIWSRCLLPAGEGTSHGSLSLEPAVTTLEALKWGIYAVTFQLAVHVASKRGALPGVTIVFVSGVMLALATLAHDLVGAKAVFGIYEPRHLSVYARVAPLLNPNNLAGYLALSVLCGLSILQSRRNRVSPWLVGAGIVVLVGVAFRAASRGGLVALLFGVVAAGTWTLVRQQRQRRGKRHRGSWRPYIFVGVAICIGLGMGVLGADRATWAALVDESTEKLAIPAMTAALVADFKLFGVGRGAFESTFVAYRPALATHVTYTHPENLPAQWISEWGLPVGLAALLALGWLLRPSRLGVKRSTLNATAAVGVIVLLVHNLVDLSLELPGVAIAAFVVLGTLWGDASRRGSAPPRRPVDRAALASAGALVALLLVLCVVRRAESLYDERVVARRLVEQAASDHGRARAARDHLREALLRHPADYYFPQLGALLALRTRTENAMPWIQRALERGPTVGRNHLVLAEILAANGARRQALLELRYAVEFEGSLATTAAAMALQWTEDPDEVLITVPAGPPGAAMLDQLAGAARARERIELSETLDREALSRDASLRAPRERLARALLVAFEKSEAPCAERAPCAEEILGHARSLVEHYPKSSVGRQVEAELAMKEHREADARRILSEACDLPEDRLSCLQRLAEVESDERLPAVIDKYTSLACSRRKACANAWELAANEYLRRNLPGQAMSAAERAAREEPSVERWVRAADLAERAGQPAQAVICLEQAQRLAGEFDARIAARLASLRRSRHQ